jgi:excisionase family DNA binding protein
MAFYTSPPNRQATTDPRDRNRDHDTVEDGLVTVKQAAEFLAISVSGVYALMDRRELPFTKLGRSRRIPRRALVELAARNLVGGADA